MRLFLESQILQSLISNSLKVLLGDAHAEGNQNQSVLFLFWWENKNHILDLQKYPKLCILE